MRLQILSDKIAVFAILFVCVTLQNNEHILIYHELQCPLNNATYNFIEFVSSTAGPNASNGD